jgi:hypothetical protein
VPSDNDYIFMNIGAGVYYYGSYDVEAKRNGETFYEINL